MQIRIACKSLAYSPSVWLRLKQDADCSCVSKQGLPWKQMQMNTWAVARLLLIWPWSAMPVVESTETPCNGPKSTHRSRVIVCWEIMCYFSIQFLFFKQNLKISCVQLSSAALRTWGHVSGISSDTVMLLGDTFQQIQSSPQNAAATCQKGSFCVQTWYQYSIKDEIASNEQEF